MIFIQLKLIFVDNFGCVCRDIGFEWITALEPSDADRHRFDRLQFEHDHHITAAGCHQFDGHSALAASVRSGGWGTGWRPSHDARPQSSETRPDSSQGQHQGRAATFALRSGESSKVSHEPKKQNNEI